MVIVFGVMMVGGELLAALLPAHNKTNKAHLVMAEIMSIGMLGLCVLFILGVGGFYRGLELAFLIVMIASASLTLIDKRRYIAYELGFIYISHISILIATLAVR